MMTRTSRPSPRKAGGSAPATSARPPTLANGAASAVTKRTRIAFVRSRPAVRALVAILSVAHFRLGPARQRMVSGGNSVPEAPRGTAERNSDPSCQAVVYRRRIERGRGAQRVNRTVDPSAYTPQELMVAAGARQIRDGEAVFVGM